jgi:hypothetical protein
VRSDDERQVLAGYCALCDDEDELSWESDAKELVIAE